MRPGNRRLLVVVFLRGGADGLALVPPVGDPAYYDARPTIAVPEPGVPGGALPLDDRFGLHPALAALLPRWEAKDLAIVHAVGSDDTTRSHFEAQDRMERASTRADGWLARHLRTAGAGAGAGAGAVGPMSAVALGAALPVSLQGVPAAALGEGGLASLSLDAPAPYLAALSALWAGASPLARAGAQALDVLEQVKAVADAAVPELPPTRLGRALAVVVRLVRADVGLEVAHVDVGGWDSHFVQEAVLGPLAEELGTALAALPEALGAAWARTTVVVWTEFGRRIVENTSLGTDHGRGGVAFVLGGAVAGGVVHADWPGLGPGPGTDGVPDLPVTTDFREIAAEVALWAGNPRIDEVLPDWEPRGLGLYREASLRVPDSSWPGASGWPR